MRATISDPAATAFSTGFYRALAFGCGYEQAYELGCNQMALMGHTERAPVLHRRGAARG